MTHKITQVFKTGLAQFFLIFLSFFFSFTFYNKILNHEEWKKKKKKSTLESRVDRKQPSTVSWKSGKRNIIDKKVVEKRDHDGRHPQVARHLVGFQFMERGKKRSKPTL